MVRKSLKIFEEKAAEYVHSWMRRESCNSVDALIDNIRLVVLEIFTNKLDQAQTEGMIDLILSQLNDLLQKNRGVFPAVKNRVRERTIQNKVFCQHFSRQNLSNAVRASSEIVLEIKKSDEITKIIECVLNSLVLKKHGRTEPCLAL